MTCSLDTACTNDTRYSALSQPDKLEHALYAPFAKVLSDDVQGKTEHS